MKLRMYVIYYSPKDYPDEYVVRGWTVKGTAFAPDIFATCLTNDLEQARAAVPKGCVKLERHPRDDPAIVEMWI